MVTDSGRGALHRYITVPGGAHADGLVALDEEHLRPMPGNFTAAFADLETWTRPTSGRQSRTAASRSGPGWTSPRRTCPGIQEMPRTNWRPGHAFAYIQ